MARPKRGNYATGEAGLARYKEALRKYLAKTKKTTKPEVKKPVAKKPVAKKPATKKPATKKPVAKKPPVKKPVAKKPVAKKPVAKKPVAKKPVAKKPATKVPAKKPLISNQNKLRIKKAATTATKTAKKLSQKVGKTKKAITKKAGQLKQAIKKGKAPTPKTPQQKFVSKAYRGAKSYGKKVLKKGGKDLLKIGKGILKNPKSAIKGGVAGLAAAAAQDVINKRVNKLLGVEGVEKKGKGIGSLTKKLVKRVRGKSGESSATRNINKQKKANTVPNRGLKVKKTIRSSRKNTNKDYNAPTATKKADKRFSTFRVNPDENLKLQKERQKGNTETYSRKLSPQAKKTKTTVRTDIKSPKPRSARAKMRAKNEARFGKAHVDKLRAKNRDFQLMRKKKMTKAEFIRRYPNSQTAKRARGL